MACQALMAVCIWLFVCMNRLSELCASTHKLLRLLRRLAHATIEILQLTQPKVAYQQQKKQLALASTAHHPTKHPLYVHGLHTILIPILCPTTVLFPWHTTA